MAKFLFEVEHKNRLEQRGLLKRFTIDCYGKQESLEEMRAEKAEKFKELKNKRNSKEFQMWFLKYIPAESKNENKPEPVSEIQIEKEINPGFEFKKPIKNPLLKLFGKKEETEKEKTEKQKTEKQKTEKKSDIEITKSSEYLV
jgi:hypothetical protein